MNPIEIAFLQLVSKGLSFGYSQNRAELTFKDDFTWLVVFQNMNRMKYAVFKSYNGQYSAVEI